MATTVAPKSIFESIWFPLVGAGLYLSYSRYKQHDLIPSLAISALIWAGLSLPAVRSMASSAKESATDLVQNATSAVMPTATMEDINAMNKTGRQAAIDYLIISEKNKTLATNAASPSLLVRKPADVDKMTAVLKTFTNNELKVMYVMQKFVDKNKELGTKYNLSENPELAKKVALDEFGIDLSGIPDVKATAQAAFTKGMI